MGKISNEKVSRYRKKLSLLIAKLQEKSFRAIDSDLIFKGTPAEIYRTCGSKKCKCSKGGENRHGPYKVIQVMKAGKARQLVLRKGRERYYDMAKSYVWQMRNLKDIKSISSEIQALVQEFIALRAIEEIEDE